MRKGVGVAVAAMAVVAPISSEAVVDPADECSWDRRASLPPTVQRYLSLIFQKPEDRYRPFRFSLEEYFDPPPGYLSRRVERFADIDKSRPYSLYQSNSNFPAGLLQHEAGTPAPFYRYWESNRAWSSFRLSGHDSADFAGLGPVSLVGFDPRFFTSPEAQAAAIVGQNPGRFQNGKYRIEQAGDACLVVTQADGDRLTALLTIYDGQPGADRFVRTRDFMQCRDQHYGRFLGLRFGPSPRPYSPGVEPVRAPDYDYSKLPLAPPPRLPRPVSSSRPPVWGPTFASLAEGQASAPPIQRNHRSGSEAEIFRSDDAMQIIALDGASDFAGVCRVAMDLHGRRLTGDVLQWADERRAKRTTEGAGLRPLPDP